MSVQTFFAELEDLQAPAEVAEAEEAYSGGVADLGDADAAYWVQAVEAYPAYRAALAEAAQAHLGSRFTVWRAMTADAREEWEAGADIGPISVTFNSGLAKAWNRLAINQGRGFHVAQFEATPAMIVMRGKLEEQEIVIDGNEVSYGDLHFLNESAEDIVNRLLG